jgi:penicillin-binding protein 1A
VFLAIFFAALSAGWLGFMPSFEELENPKSKLASEVISADQKV